MADEKRVAVVTGGGQGIGEAIAHQLSKDGYAVVVADLNNDTATKVAESIKNEGGQAVAVQGDVSKKSDAQKFVQTAVDNFGRLDTYVNNAGIIIIKPSMDTTEEELERITKINLWGTMFAIQAAATQFEKQDDGDKIRKIICASSVAGHFGYPMEATYCATKFGVRGFVQSFATELAKDHITVNAYCPGICDTPMWKDIDAALVKYQGGKPGDYLKSYSNSISLGRTEQPQDVADFVSYLASHKSDYMNGQSVQIDGGMTMI